MQDLRQDQRKIAAHPAVPAVFSRTCVKASFHRACEYTHEIAVAMAFHAVPVKGLHLLGCKAVGAHKFHGFSAQNIYAVVCTAAHEHLHKSGVVADSGDKTCSARFECRRLLLVKNAEVVTCVREISLFRAVIYLSKSALLFGRNIEARVLHAQRSKYFLFQKFAELHSRNSLDNSAHNIGRSTVLPPCTGSERQRLLPISRANSRVFRSFPPFSHASVC